MRNIQIRNSFFYINRVSGLPTFIMVMWGRPRRINNPKKCICPIELPPQKSLRLVELHPQKSLRPIVPVTKKTVCVFYLYSLILSLEMIDLHEMDHLVAVYQIYACYQIRFLPQWWGLQSHSQCIAIDNQKLYIIRRGARK